MNLSLGFRFEERPALGNDPVWRESEDGRAMTLVITKAGLAAVGMSAADDRREKPADKAKGGPAPFVSENQPRMPRAGSKLAMLVDLLSRAESATIEELASEVKWQRHTARAVLSGTLKSKFGLTVESKKVDGKDRTYFIS